jgi:hypothetical protein
VFIDARTAKKISFLGSSTVRTALQQDMESAVIPTWLGGTCPYVYDPAHVLGGPEGSPNPYVSTAPAGPMGHLPRAPGSAFPQAPEAAATVEAVEDEVTGEAAPPAPPPVAVEEEQAAAMAKAAEEGVDLATGEHR